MQSILLNPIDDKKKALLEMQRLLKEQRSMLHSLNEYITKDEIDRHNIDVYIRHHEEPDAVILKFLIYLMRDKYQCNYRHNQNKLVAHAFTKILIKDDFSWSKLREIFMGTWNQFDITSEQEKQSCRAASAAYCAYVFGCVNHLKVASYQSNFNVESENRQSYELLKILQNGETK